MAEAKQPFEDKYLDLKDENIALKKKKNEQEDTIKRMYTKLAMLEETLKRKEKDQVPEADSPGKGGTGGMSCKRDMETERFIHELRRENAALRRKTQAMAESTRYGLQRERQKAAAVHHLKKKSPLPAATKPSPSHAHSSSANDNNNGLEAHSSMARAMHHHYASSAASSHGKTGSLETALKARMVTAERQVVQLQRENDNLKDALAARSHHAHNNNSDHDSVEHLQRELRDRQAQLVILNARFDNLESKAMAEREIQEKTLEQMDNFNRVIHRLRSDLQEAHVVRDEMEKKVAKAKDMRDELEILRAQNQKLEDRMTNLCESPFINDAFQRKERIDKLVALESQTKQQQLKIDAMHADTQKHMAVIQELQTNIRLVKQAKDAADQELLRVKQLLDEERLQLRQWMHQQPTSSPLTRQPSIDPPSPKQPPQRQATSKATSPMHQPPSASATSQDMPVPIQTIPVQRAAALPLVLRKGIVDDPSHTPFLEGTDGGPPENNVSYLRHKVHTLQIAHLSSTQELERCEKMLQAQTSINRELSFEIEELVTRKDAGHTALRKKLDEIELVADTRLRKIAMLEAQLRQLKYMRTSRRKQHGADDNDEDLWSALGDGEDDGPPKSIDESTLDLLTDPAVDLAAGENLLEIWVVGGEFDPKHVNGTGCTFVLCDFFDFESQSTSLVLGNRPAYNFAATYKITADAFFLRYLASESLALEVHQAVKGDFHVVGRTALRLHPLLVHSTGSIKDTATPVRHITTNAVMGHLHLVIRVALPLTEIWQLHLQACPSDQAFLPNGNVAAADHAAHAAAVDVLPDDSPLNDLQVSMVACRKLYTSTGIPPSAYVHYQLLGFPDVFTDIVPSSGAPTFSSENGGVHWFTLSVDPCLKQFFRKVKLRCTVFDDNASADSSSSGVLGVCDLSLRQLVDGDPVDGWFDIVHDSSGAVVGELLVHLAWKNPLQLVDSAAAHSNALTQTQVHELMQTFSPRHDGRVNYRAFLVYAHSSVFATALFLDTIQSIRSMLHAAVAAGHEVPSTVASATSSTPGMAKDSLARVFHASGLTLPPDHVQVLVDVLGDVNGFVHPAELWRHIDPTPSCQDRFVAQKCRDVVRQFEMRERQPHKVKAPFERYDPTHCHHVSRAEFKRGLGVLGFVIYDPHADEAKADLLGTHNTVAPSSTPEQGPSSMENEADAEILKPMTSAAATTEFEQRKAAFTKRMKQAADASGKTSFVLDAPTLPSAASNRPLPPSRAARVIQQRFRAFMQQGVASSAHGPVAATPPPLTDGHVLHSTLLDVEAFLANTLSVTDDLKATLVRACQDMDETKRGRLSRKQMTFVLRPLCLTPAHLRTLLDAFRVDSSGRGQNLVMYAPVLHFVLTVQHIVPPLIKWLQSLILEENDIGPFVQADSSGTGHVPFQVFGACLRRKCPHLSSAQVTLIAQLFDLSGFGVCYRAFLDFMASQPVAIALQKIKAYLRSLPQPTKQAIQVALAQVPLDDALTKLQLTTLWKHHNVELTPADQSVLWNALDPSRLGTVSPATLWTVLFQPAASNAITSPSAMVPPLDMSLLQQLTWNSRRHVAPDSDAILAAFTRYDWAKTGGIGVPEFAAVLQQVGFVLSTDALRQLARHFYNHGHVQYVRFLQWSRPPDVAYAQLQTRLQHFLQRVAATHDMSMAAVVGQWRQAFPSPPVSRQVFASVVAQPPLALPLNAAEVRAVLSHLDPDCHDVVDVDAFLRLADNNEADPSCRPANHDDADTAVLSTLQGVVAKAGKHEVLRLFEAYDGTKKGVVEPAIFGLVWRKLGVELSPEDVHWVFSEFAKDGHQLAYRKFLRHHLKDHGTGNAADADNDDMAAARRRGKHRALLVQMLQTAATDHPEDYNAWRREVACRTKSRPHVSTDKALSILIKSQDNALGHRDLIDMHLFDKFMYLFTNNTNEEASGDEQGGQVCVAMLLACLDSAAPLPPPHAVASTTEAPPSGVDCTAVEDAVRVLGLVLCRCVEQGKDYRRAIDRHDDPTWRGVVARPHLKSSLLELGFNVVDGGMRFIGTLLGAFRDRTGQDHDAINYIHLLHAGRRAANLPSDPSAVVWQLDEAFRAQVRQKCQVTYGSEAGVGDACAPLERAFNHFDRDDVGFLTMEAFVAGLHALHYDPSAAEAQALFDSMAVFRTATPPVVSRVEFDAFVLDPHRDDLLTHLHSRVSSFSQLSHALAAADPRGSGELPVSTFGDVLAAHGLRVSRSDLTRLQYLFDVNRTGTVLSYKLWLRVVARGIGTTANGADDTDSHDSVLHAIRRTLQTYLANNNGGATPAGTVTTAARACLEAADTTHSGALAVADFYLTMKHMGLVLAPEQVRELVLRYPGGTDKRQIDYLALMADAAPAEQGVMERVMMCMEDAIERGVDVLTRLRRLDATGHGTLTAAQFRVGLEELGVSLCDADMPQIMAGFGGEAGSAVELRHVLQHVRVQTTKGLLRKLVPLSDAATDRPSSMDRTTFASFCAAQGIAALTASQWKVLEEQFGTTSQDAGVTIDVGRVVQSVRAVGVQAVLHQLCEGFKAVGAVAKDVGQACLAHDDDYTGQISTSQFFGVLDKVIGTQMSPSDRRLLHHAPWIVLDRVHYRDFVAAAFHAHV
ncbi:hypothetical protein H310_02954 [Aphanomyces invadans]|uniref:Uncharacterized protein n=1 Tax=Aphanomyces invadans TaxID=157072 RepID=A0A024UMF8_9STRA|nr:hypothetical protein H310_02954 [Aphanomyces invadans]ETW06803.1 hypothetical protein H310_02954 [Aphanomyces invadans]|eukprot:XP_008864878.1 hypothetical protein H310_02954 [Aphanomyces invadans]